MTVLSMRSFLESLRLSATTALGSGTSSFLTVVSADMWVCLMRLRLQRI